MITVVGFSPALDVTYVVDDLVVGGLHRPAGTVRHLGGKAVNVARVAAALGAPVRVVLPLRSIDVETLGPALEAGGVELVAVESSVPLRMCVSIASLATSRMTEVYEHAPALAPEVVTGVVRAAADAVGAGRIAVSGSVPADAVGAIAALIRSGRGSAIDTHGEALAVGVAARAGLVKVNRVEAEALAGLPVGSTAVELASALSARSGGAVVVTDSTAGVAAVDGSERWVARPTGIVGAFSQGSGDAMLAGMLAGLETGGDLLDALRLGVGAATANALRPGGGVLDADRAREVAAGVEIVRA